VPFIPLGTTNTAQGQRETRTHRVMYGVLLCDTGSRCGWRRTAATGAAGRGADVARSHHQSRSNRRSRINRRSKSSRSRTGQPELAGGHAWGTHTEFFWHPTAEHQEKKRRRTQRCGSGARAGHRQQQHNVVIVGVRAVVTAATAVAVTCSITATGKTAAGVATSAVASAVATAAAIW
jgi:hypothetical protein